MQIIVVIIIIFTSPFGVPCHTPSARTKVLHSGQWRIQARPPPLLLDQSEARRAEKIIFKTGSPPPPNYLRVWMTVVSFAAVIRVVKQRSSPLTAVSGEERCVKKETRMTGPLPYLKVWITAGLLL